MPIDQAALIGDLTTGRTSCTAGEGVASTEAPVEESAWHPSRVTLAKAPVLGSRLWEKNGDC